MYYAVLLEVGRFVTLVPVQYKDPIYTLRTSSGIFIKVFNLFETRLIIYLLITCRLNNPVVQEVPLNILTREVVLPLNYKKRRNTPTFSTCTNDYCSLFPVPWLNCLAFTTLIGACNDYRSANNAHYKARLVKVIEIAVKYAIFLLRIRYKLEPRAKQLGIFA